MQLNLDPTGTAPAVDQAQQKTIGAAKDFEALLISQILKSMRDENSGWLGSGQSGSDDDGESNDAILSLGEQQIAKALAASGGLGLAHMIQTNLTEANPARESGVDH